MQRFWEITHSVKESPWNMNSLHSQPHYEIYYLVRGSRDYLFTNTAYHIEAPCIIIIPPYTMHMTEGDAFEKYSIDVSEEYLNEYQKRVLAERSTKILKPDEKQNEEFMRLFSEMATVERHGKESEEIISALFGYCVHAIQKLESPSTDAVVFERTYIPPLVLKAVNYLNVSYGEKHSLDSLSERFFVSKATVLYNFNKYLHCSPMDFLITLRLNKAKEMLLNTKKSIKEISETCGFSSPNYFCLIFKRKEHISPGNYRKYQNEKE